MGNAKAATLIDRFSGGSLDPTKWIQVGFPVVLQNELKIKNNIARTGVVSVNKYDLTGSFFSVHLRTEDQAQFLLKVDVPDGYLQMSLSKGKLTSTAKQNGVSVKSVVPFDPTGMQWWRIKEGTGNLTFDVSTNGSAWTSIFSQARTIDVGAAGVQMVSYAGGFGFGPWGRGPLGGTVSSGLKSKVVGGYFAKYKSTDDMGVTRDMTFQEIDPRYNVVFLFQAGPIDADAGTYPVGTGAINLISEGGGSYFTPQEWKDGVKFLRNRGTTVILTVGGGGAYIDLSSRAKTLVLIDSVKRIYGELGGVDGVDFNLETSFAYLRGGIPIPVPSSPPPAISCSSDGKTITDPGLLNRVTYNGDPDLLTTNELAQPGFVQQVKITTGTGAGQYRNIVANTSSTFTVDVAFSPKPDSTSLYEIALPIYPDEVVFAAKEFRKLWGANFSISIPAAGSFVGPFIQHDLDLVTALYTNKDATGKILLDFLAPQFYDLWYDQPSTTNAARASYAVATIKTWAAKVNNDWSRIGMGFLTNGPTGSAMSSEASRIAYLLTQVDNPTLRGAFHFDIQGDHRTTSPAGARDQWEWISDLQPIIEATEIGGTPAPPLSGTPTTFSDATGWTLSGGATVSGGNLNLPFGSYGDIRQATLNGSARDLADGYLQIELTARPTVSEGWIDLGFEGASSAEYSFLRLYTTPASTGFELHTKTTAGTEKTAYYPYPVPTGTVFLRIRKLFDYAFLSVSTPTDNKLRTIGFEDLAFVPGSSNMHIFIRSNGQGTAGAWTIASFNMGGPA